MKTVSIKDLEDHLGVYLHEARDGATVIVTDGDSVIAELRPPSVETATSSHDQILDQLFATGLLVEGLPQDPCAYRKSPLPHAVVVADLLDAERMGR